MVKKSPLNQIKAAADQAKVDEAPDNPSPDDDREPIGVRWETVDGPPSTEDGNGTPETVTSSPETVDGKPSTGDGKPPRKRSTVARKRSTGNRRRATGNGVPETDDGKPSTADRVPVAKQPATVRRKRRTVDGVPETVHRPPSTGDQRWDEANRRVTFHGHIRTQHWIGELMAITGESRAAIHNRALRELLERDLASYDPLRDP